MDLLQAGATVAEVQANVSRQFADIASWTPLQEVGTACRAGATSWGQAGLRN